MTFVKTVAALLVVIFANGVLFSKIIWNRTGEPVGALTLSQCDIPALSSGYGWRQDRKLWLSVASVEGEGIARENGRQPEKRTADLWKKRHYYVVLRHGGAEWAESYLAWPKKRKSGMLHKKLILVDGSHDLDALQAKYKGDDNAVIEEGYRNRHMIPNKWALIRSTLSYDSEYREIIKTIRFESKLAREAASKSKGGKYICTPNFHITVTWGALREPWISNIERIS